MKFAFKSSVSGCKISYRRIALAATLLGLSAPAYATNYNEGPVIGGPGAPHEANDLSSIASAPTNIGSLTLGSNFITGATIPYGPIVNPVTMELQTQDNDYVSFTVPFGDILTGINLIASSALVPDGTVIQPNDLFFVGIASGTSVNVSPPSSTGLLGFTLLSSGAIGSNILPNLGLSAPPGFAGPPFSGATTFSGALPSGTYTLWLLDGDNPVNYKLNLLVAAAPEPGTWLMMIVGFGLVGTSLRRRQVANNSIFRVA